MNRSHFSFFFITGISLFVFYSCSTSPFTEPEEDQAVLVLVLENTTGVEDSLTMQVGGKVETLTFPAEGKTLQAFVIDSWEEKLFDVENNSITLSEQVYVLTERGLEFRDLIPEDRRMAAELLIDTYGFYHWADRKPVNFYPYQPRRFEFESYPVSLETDRPVQAWVDGVNWGTAPLDITLPPGRHQVIYKDGEKELFRTFIQVSEASRFTHRISSEDGNEENAGFQVVLGDFSNMGSPDLDYLMPLIRDGIALEVGSNPRILLDSEQTGDSLKQAEERGAEMILSGHYFSKDQRIMIHVSLEDVKTGQIRSADLFQTDLGLDILGSIDSIAEKVSLAVDRQLPEPGETFYQVVDRFDESLIEVEKALAIDYIEKTQGDRPNDLSLSLGLPVLYGYNHDNQSASLGLMSTAVRYERAISRNWDLRIGAEYLYSTALNSTIYANAASGYYNLILTGDFIYSLASSEQRNFYIGSGCAYHMMEALGGDALVWGDYLQPRFIAGIKVFRKQRISAASHYLGMDLDIPAASIVTVNTDNVEFFNPVNFHFTIGRKF